MQNRLLASALLLAAVAAPPVVSAADRKAAVDQLVQPLIEAGAIPGIVVGVLEDGKTQVFGYGKGAGGKVPDASSIFEIGSITKTFTTTALAEMVQRKMVALEDPVRKYLPADAIPPGTAGEAEIRLIDLASQHSGLPRMPSNFHPKNPENPYADYSPQLLYEFLSKQTLRLKPDAGFLYSNLGMGTLGQALSLRYGKSWEQMVSELVTTPLGMTDTRVTFTADMRSRLAPGHDADGKVAANWDLDALVGAGGLRSDATDMLRYVRAQMEPPEKLKGAIELAHVERHKIGGGMAIALAWLIKPDGKTYWHNGGTGGYTAYNSFNAEHKTGVVVLVNGSGNLMDQIGDRVEHILANETVQPVPFRRAVTLDSKLLEEYVGAYELTPAIRLTVTRNGDQLFVQLTGQGPLGLFADAKDKFFLRAVEAAVTFDRDEQGHVIDAVLRQNGRDQKAKRVQ
jgi:D-alanyl-D-alanine-carboxypeptidase/D-alanyl-D-alanine-endopeptidase